MLKIYYYYERKWNHEQNLVNSQVLSGKIERLASKEMYSATESASHKGKWITKATQDSINTIYNISNMIKTRWYSQWDDT